MANVAQRIARGTHTRSMVLHRATTWASIMSAGTVNIRRNLECKCVCASSACTVAHGSRISLGMWASVKWARMCIALQLDIADNLHSTFSMGDQGREHSTTHESVQYEHAPICIHEHVRAGAQRSLEAMTEQSISNLEIGMAARASPQVAHAEPKEPSEVANEHAHESNGSGNGTGKSRQIGEQSKHSFFRDPLLPPLSVVRGLMPRIRAPCVSRRRLSKKRPGAEQCEQELRPGPAPRLLQLRQPCGTGPMGHDILDTTCKLQHLMRA